MKRNWKLLAACAAFIVLGTAAAATPSDEERALHLLNRLAYGPAPGDIERVRRMGTQAYIEQQLHPERIELPSGLTRQLDALPLAAMSAGALLGEFYQVRRTPGKEDETEKMRQRDFVRQAAEEAAQARLLRAISSPRQLEEVMVEFWYNHFNVFAGKGLDRALVTSYEREAIRPYVFGRFRDLLGATAHHPAMLFYLDNWLSAAPGAKLDAAARPQAARRGGLNENYARELMELHTLGVEAGYTQKDVTELARMLTGWTFNPRALAGRGEGFRFDERRHDWGSKEWLGRQVAPRGQEEGEWALDVLAAHPSTARHVSYRLAQYFVKDEPPPALVARLARQFQQSQGDIRAVLRTLFASAEFWDSTGAKFKPPYRYVVSAVRAADVPVANFRPLLAMLNQQGMPPYGCQTPDGYKYTEQAWLNPDALARRLNFATALGTGRLPLAPALEAREGSSFKAGMNQELRRGEAGTPVDPDSLLAALASSVSARTRDTAAGNPPGLRAALVLGSPDFMRH